MKAAVLESAKNLVIKDVPEPLIISATQIKVKVEACGLCASESAKWFGKMGGFGEIIGHEPVGTVVEIGSEVTKFNIGDRVAAGFCQKAFAQYVVEKQNLFAKIPMDMSIEDALIEPPSCILGAINRVPMQWGWPVAVVGCGYMGLMLIKMMKTYGTSKIVAVDYRQESLGLAKKCGADECYNPEDLPKEYFVEGFNSRTFIDGFPVVYEVTGNETALNLASRMVRGNGYLNIIGYHTGPRTLDWKMCNLKGLNIINSHEKDMTMRGLNAEMIRDMILAGRFTAKELVNAKYNLDQINDGFTDMIEKKNGYIKGYISMEDILCS